MNTEHAFVITAVYSPQSDNRIDPTYKRLCDELNTAAAEKNRTLNNFLGETSLVPEKAVAFGNAHLRWKRAGEALHNYSFGLL
jgi:hypothetical protein